MPWEFVTADPQKHLVVWMIAANEVRRAERRRESRRVQNDH